eukprot:20010-Prorocentrum_minimum.AAC.1
MWANPHESRGRIQTKFGRIQVLLQDFAQKSPGDSKAVTEIITIRRGPGRRSPAGRGRRGGRGPPWTGRVTAAWSPLKGPGE